MDDHLFGIKHWRMVANSSDIAAVIVLQEVNIEKICVMRTADKV